MDAITASIYTHPRAPTTPALSLFPTLCGILKTFSASAAQYRALIGTPGAISTSQLRSGPTKIPINLQHNVAAATIAYSSRIMLRATLHQCSIAAKE